ncbi:Uncharacterized conserved protein YndB, AHSA1/START domain [Microbacterium sp. cf046]|uniref:SRPBCC family protein n=1 Tax=Microbacterium sp. cf046 TaxID=1761803 RepID=UPI0008EC98EB|nr:SRPBCC domain-containing protein [Microbacterium sp. cf046]SFS02511.1 Uncharacterized conserved protein YndB, AHSA1/START domain [Microbacterium sp. cf046]
MYELTEEALVAASVDVVWRDFTDPTALAAWIWPPRFETTAAVDPHPQGSWQVRSEVVPMAVLATVLELDAPQELRLAWRWDGEEQSTDVDITLEPAGDDSTRVAVRHSGFETADERDSHVQGWSDCLQRLVHAHSS